MQYFNRSNSEVDFIKDKLRSQYIPTVRVFSSKANIQPIPKNSAYSIELDDDVITNEAGEQYFDGESIIYDNTIQTCSADENNQLVKLNYKNKYVFGKFYPNISTNYISNKGYYDSDLHEYLGRYLRAYRDFTGIDVMNFYNCFSNRYISSYTLPIDPIVMPQALTSKKPNPTPSTEEELSQLGAVKKNKTTSAYKLIAFPILFDTKYSIKFYADYVGEIEYQAVWFNGESPLGAVEMQQKNPSEPLSQPSDVEAITHKVFVSSTISICIGSKDAKRCYYKEQDNGSTVLTIEQDPNAISKQRLLYLFIKFSSTLNAPIVVLEQPKFTYAINNELMDLSTTNKEQIAFSDVLLEYLTDSVITPDDTIHQNVHRIQKKILSSSFKALYGVGGPDCDGADIPNYKMSSGVFDQGLHNIIYKAFFNLGCPQEEDGVVYYPKGTEKVSNFLGFVDKNIEELIMRVPDDNQGGSK